MPKKGTDRTIAHETELAISGIESISILPGVASRFFANLLSPTASPSELFEMVESDPGLAVKIFSLMHKKGLSYSDDIKSIGQVLEKLPSHLIRDTFLSVQVSGVFGQKAETGWLREGLVRHSIATGCCAKDIVELASVNIDSHLAYLGGLLHDIGKLALEQTMPKSFGYITEQAQIKKCSSYLVERNHLGTDHTILGKRLAKKWHLPKEIGLAIWLHHNETGLICENIPEAKIAQVVQLADLIARQCETGESGSYDEPKPPSSLLSSLGISQKQAEIIRRDLPRTVDRKCNILGLNLHQPQEEYCRVVHETAVQLSKRTSELSLEQKRLQTAAAHYDFIMDFLSSVNSETSVTETMEKLALLWQRFYQTGIVCVYLANTDGSDAVEAVVVESQTKSKTVLLKVPQGTSVVPSVLSDSFAILDVDEGVSRLFEQLDVEFDLGNSKLVPLLSRGQAIGAIVFEWRCPAEIEQILEKFKAIVGVAGGVLDTAMEQTRQQHFAERFVQLIGPSVALDLGEEKEELLEALAEMAAGAAHELNNPLGVISGRSQLLSNSEIDAEKKRILKLIEENAGQVSRIVDELMGFAKPEPPRKSKIETSQILDEAVQLTTRRSGLENLDIKVDIDDSAQEVFVDSAQIATAVSNVLCNCLESYSQGNGRIVVKAYKKQNGEFVKVEITDYGCGMDEATVRKAKYPFFSAKPAGRKRGMGLAYAQRFVKLNKGDLNINSRPDSGTTVTIVLPCEV